MKKIFLAFIFAMSIFTINAQNTTDEVALIQSEYGLNKKQLIVEHMKFSEAESAKFWPIYDNYEMARKELGKQRLNNVLDFANNYEKINDEKATELVNLTFDNHVEFTKLQRKTFKEISDAISPVRAAQFIQLEVYLETVVRMTIQEEIPMIKKIESANKD